MPQERWPYSFTLLPKTRAMLGRLADWSDHGVMSRVVEELVVRDYERQRERRKRKAQA